MAPNPGLYGKLRGYKCRDRRVGLMQPWRDGIKRFQFEGRWAA
jgi:hypothetical protein